VKEQFASATLTAPFVETIRDRMDLKGANALFRWERTFDPTSSISVQMYYDYTFRDEAVFKDVLHTGDFDFQHRFTPTEGNDVIWGVGYRIYRSTTDGSFTFNVNPPGHTDDVISAFIQDEILLFQGPAPPDARLEIRAERLQRIRVPADARLAWTPEETHMAWASLTRAVRTPSIIDNDGRLTPTVIGGGAVPIALSIFGNERTSRRRRCWRPRRIPGAAGRPALGSNLALFMNHYDRIRTGSIGAPFLETTPPPLHAVIPVNLETVSTGRRAAWSWRRTPAGRAVVAAPGELHLPPYEHDTRTRRTAAARTNRCGSARPWICRGISPSTRRRDTSAAFPRST